MSHSCVFHGLYLSIDMNTLFMGINWHLVLASCLRTTLPLSLSLNHRGCQLRAFLRPEENWVSPSWWCSPYSKLWVETLSTQSMFWVNVFVPWKGENAVNTELRIVKAEFHSWLYHTHVMDCWAGCLLFLGLRLFFAIFPNYVSYMSRVLIMNSETNIHF